MQARAPSRSRQRADLHPLPLPRLSVPVVGDSRKRIPYGLAPPTHLADNTAKTRREVRCSVLDTAKTSTIQINWREAVGQTTDKNYMNKIQKESFFTTLSTKIGSGDLEFAKSCYYALVKTIMAQLRTFESVGLPDLGEMKIIRRPAHQRHHVGLRQMVEQPETKELKFYPADKCKFYIRNMMKTNRDITNEK